MLALAAEREYERSNVEYLLADAYSLEGVRPGLDGGFHFQWISHVPRARLQEFFASFHRKLSAGAVVVFGDNKEEGGTPDSDGNLYQDRTLPGGALRAGEQRVPGREAMKYRVIKNWLRIEELRALLAPWTDTVELQEFERDWFVCYSLRG